jgi:hypothetical protein
MAGFNDRGKLFVDVDTHILDRKVAFQSHIHTGFTSAVTESAGKSSCPAESPASAPILRLCVLSSYATAKNPIPPSSTENAIQIPTYSTTL